jgi:hypothetical protein
MVTNKLALFLKRIGIGPAIILLIIQMNSYFVVVSRSDDLLFELESFKPDYYTAVYPFWLT